MNQLLDEICIQDNNDNTLIELETYDKELKALMLAIENNIKENGKEKNITISNRVKDLFDF